MLQTLIVNIAALIVTLGILVTIHEFGHFWVARKCGVKVLRFSIGFGKAVKTWYGKDGTEYVIAPIPLGGYVKMLGQDRKSTRLNSSHVRISYAVFCLKKKNTNNALAMHIVDQARSVFLPYVIFTSLTSLAHFALYLDIQAHHLLL